MIHSADPRHLIVGFWCLRDTFRLGHLFYQPREHFLRLTVETGENSVSLRVDPRKGKDAAELSEMLTAWAEQSEKYRNGEINREDYDKWRYNYPKYDETSGYVKAPSQQLSDAMVEAFKDRLKDK